MALKTYEIGAAFERRVKAHLEKMGYYVVRAAGSHSEADLLCVRGKNDGTLEGIVVQCKSNGVLPQYERDALIKIKVKHFPLRILHAFKDEKGHIEFEEL